MTFFLMVKVIGYHVSIYICKSKTHLFFFLFLGLQAELTAAYKESECVRKKLKQLEEELDNFKQKNSDLTDELNRKKGA